ncbi:hypothetical protein JL720_7060 [Aureococcus anophagefferens]|nr:hypothetical protein JL720_7060 [Aureococcus anophagefferens]
MALQALASRRSQYVVGALCALVLLHRLARAPEVLRADTSMLPFGAASNLTAELRALDATLALLERRLRPAAAAPATAAPPAQARPRRGRDRADIDALRRRGRGGGGGGGDAAAFRGLDARLRRVEAAVAAARRGPPRPRRTRQRRSSGDAPAPRPRPSNAPPAPAPTQGPGYRARRLAFNESLPRLPAPVSPAASGPAAACCPSAASSRRVTSRAAPSSASSADWGLSLSETTGRLLFGVGHRDYVYRPRSGRPVRDETVATTGPSLVDDAWHSVVAVRRRRAGPVAAGGGAVRDGAAFDKFQDSELLVYVDGARAETAANATGGPSAPRRRRRRRGR